MSEMVDTWKMLAAGLTQRIEGVSADQWDAQSNCDEWTVRQLVEHAVDAQRAIPTALGADCSMELGDNPAAAWGQIMAAATQALEADGAMEQVVQGPMGEQPAGHAMGIMSMDMLLHTFDIARSTGGDERLPEAAVTHALEQLRPMDDMLRSSGMFGPKLDVSADADAQTQLLAFTGRQA